MRNSIITVVLIAVASWPCHAQLQLHENTELVGTFIGYDMTAMESIGDTAYLASENLLIAADISVPSAPVFLDTLEWEYGRGRNAPGMVLQYPYLYLTVTPDSVFIVDIADPANLSFVHKFQVEEDGYRNVNEVLISGEFLLVCDMEYIHVYDISDPYNPIQTDRKLVNWSWAGSPDEPSPVFVRDSLILYDSSNYLRVGVLTERGRIENRISRYSIQTFNPGQPWITDSVLYLPEHRTTHTYNISGDWNLEKVASFDTEGYVKKHYTIDNKLFVLASIGFVSVYDVSDPYFPERIARFASGVWGPFTDFIVRGDYIFISSYAGMGVIVIKLTGTTGLSPVQPSTAFLSPAYPNPVSGSITISYSLATQQHITLDVYNTLGIKVQTLYDGLSEPGTHTTHLNASALSAGTYRVILRSVEGIQSQMVVVR